MNATVEALLKVLEMIRDGTEVPPHKREDTEFLRAGCVIANSMARGAIDGALPRQEQRP